MTLGRGRASCLVEHAFDDQAVDKRDRVLEAISKMCSRAIAIGSSRVGVSCRIEGPFGMQGAGRFFSGAGTMK